MKKLILVIEDEFEIRNGLARTLQLSGFDTIEASNGRIGLDMARSHIPDLIISDIMMPEMDGLDMLRELQKNEKTATIPFLFLTAKSAKSDMREGMNLGADDFITKPYDIDELLTAVDARFKKKEKSQNQFNKKFDELRSNLRKTLPHEIRTPLNIVLGLSEFLMKNYQNTSQKDACDMLENIHESGKRLNRLFENYLFFANMEIIATVPGDINRLRNKVTPLCEFVIRDMSAHHAQMAGREDDIELDLEDADLAILEEHFVKLIEEMIDNALKFSDRGTPV
ncbi:MAG: hybrid sensor histidine kinase/response regulator, partial [Bacteroidota bacterium]